MKEQFKIFVFIKCLFFHQETTDVNLYKIDRLSRNSNECLVNLRRITLGQKLGKGNFGVVYKAKGIYIPEARYRTGPKSRTSDMVEFAVKFIKDMSEEEMVKEINFSYYMSEMDLGPKMYDAFYFFNEINNSLTQVIFMEYFDMDCGKALTNPMYRQDRKQSICKQMLDWYTNNILMLV